eukprot:8443829-Pyramimonas_sp.AAC.1
MMGRDALSMVQRGGYGPSIKQRSEDDLAASRRRRHEGELAEARRQLAYVEKARKHDAQVSEEDACCGPPPPTGPREKGSR